MSWAATELETIDLGYARRNKRAIRLVEHLNAKPTASVPQACGDLADTIAATHEVVLCIQDTTELDFNGQEASGLGPLNYDVQSTPT